MTRSTPAPQASPAGTAPITVVLVHGAWADSSGWSGVIARLTDAGVAVVSPANPLRGLISDSDYLAAFLASIEGPILLVGHAYGGAVSSVAASSNPAVLGIVYVAAYALDEGETLLGIVNQFPVETLGNALRQVPIPGGTAENPALDVYLDRSLLPSVF
ncbi:MAG: alpha/beta hydrolase, partial [Thermomicrobiales bacterium]